MQERSPSSAANVHMCVLVKATWTATSEPTVTEMCITVVIPGREELALWLH